MVTKDENKYQPLIKDDKASIRPSRPHTYKGLERDKKKQNDLTNQPPQPVGFSQPEYASLEHFGPAKKEPKHSYQQLVTPKKVHEYYVLLITNCATICWERRTIC